MPQPIRCPTQEIEDKLDDRIEITHIARVSDLELLSLKQKLSKLSGNERKEISAYLLRLDQETEEWKSKAAQTINAMASGKKVSLEDLKEQLGHG
jgi:hypothetical protein